MVSKATEIARLELGADWLDSSDAARAIGTTAKTLTESIRPHVTHRSRSLVEGKGAQHVGYAYARADVERVALIKKSANVDALQAARAFGVIRRLSELGILAKVETQLPLTIGRTKRHIR